MIRPCYDLFNACGGSSPSLPYLWHYITFSFIPLRSTFGIEIFSSHVVTYIVTFDSRFETRKCDFIRPQYELFDACGGSSPSLPYLWHYITFSFIPLRSNFRIKIFSSHFVAYIVIFDSRFETRKSNIIRPHYELFHACCGSCPSLPCFWHYITFSFNPLSSTFGIWFFSSHVVAYIVSIDSRS